MTFPTTALNPDNKVVSLLVDEDGKLVTDASALPATTYPITSRSLRINDDDELEVA